MVTVDVCIITFSKYILRHFCPLLTVQRQWMDSERGRERSKAKRPQTEIKPELHAQGKCLHLWYVHGYHQLSTKPVAINTCTISSVYLLLN